MATRFQEERIGEAWEELGRTATARQIWRYLSKKYPRRPGFRNEQAVAQVVRSLRNRRKYFR